MKKYHPSFNCLQKTHILINIWNRRRTAFNAENIANSSKFATFVLFANKDLKCISAGFRVISLFLFYVITECSLNAKLLSSEPKNNVLKRLIAQYHY